MTPELTPHNETANNSDDSAADGIEGDHAGYYEHQHDEGCTALPVAVNPSDRHRSHADQQRTGEEHTAGLGESKPVTEPSPIAPEAGHLRNLSPEKRARHLVPSAARAFRDGA